mmetsp:Transcript_86257/g.180486  ORF Transcript_86257/g.180486 Transcript_86257/m.180486 type:complete len:258 (-) Transcript_86257:46-819(-)
MSLTVRLLVLAGVDLPPALSIPVSLVPAELAPCAGPPPVVPPPWPCSPPQQGRAAASPPAEPSLDAASTEVAAAPPPLAVSDFVALSASQAAVPSRLAVSFFALAPQLVVFSARCPSPFPSPSPSASPSFPPPLPATSSKPLGDRIPPAPSPARFLAPAAVAAARGGTQPRFLLAPSVFSPRLQRGPRGEPRISGASPASFAFHQRHPCPVFPLALANASLPQALPVWTVFEKRHCHLGLHLPSKPCATSIFENFSV